MERFKALKRLQEAMEDLQNYGDKKSMVDYYTSYTNMETKYGLTWNNFVFFVNFTLKGKLKQSEKQDLQTALSMGRLNHFENQIRPIVLYCFITLAIIGIIGNTLIMVYFTRKHKQNLRKMTAYHFLIIILAMVDWIYCFSSTFLHYFDWQLTWKIDSFSCSYAIPFFIVSYPNMSFWLVVLISFERYKNIVHPFSKKTSILKYSVIIFVLLLTCGCLTFISTEYFFVRHLQVKDGRKMCKWDPSLRLKFTPALYHINMNVLGQIAFMPSLLMIYFYRKISNYMKKEQKNSRNENSTKNKIRKRNQKALKVLFMLVIIFGVTSIPSRVYIYIARHFILFSLENTPALQMNYKSLLLIEHVAYLLFLLNNVVNFLVYAFMIVGFRRFLFKCLTFGLLSPYYNKGQSNSTLKPTDSSISSKSTTGSTKTLRR